ncbi:hypothetical protein QBC46DRAFT_275334 [Diplogelasinospora grovesii]|uniref:Uncharacterized protein n=1 Tax=Diplogelasinospora grovesii TaxID=303347 RepID=A0AAN6MVL0_9PEZI|nr:hypothetical protein QBC46DRAFT_275334 [Diplogelasinospora grovesii]
MTDRSRLRIIEEKPIGNGLDAFRASFNESRSIPGTADALGQLGREDLQNLSLGLLSALLNLPAVRQLASTAGYGTIRNDLLKLISAVASDNFDFDRIKPLLNAALADDLDDTLIWDEVYKTVTYRRDVDRDRLLKKYFGVAYLDGASHRPGEFGVGENEAWTLVDETRCCPICTQPYDDLQRHLMR